MKRLIGSVSALLLCLMGMSVTAQGKLANSHQLGQVSTPAATLALTAEPTAAATPLSANPADLQQITAQTVPGLQVLPISIGRGTAHSIAWSPDSKIIAVGSSQGIWFYDPDQLQTSGRLFEDQIHDITKLDFSPDGNHLLTAGERCINQIWDVDQQSTRNAWR